ncbi:MAG: tadD [Rhodospirillales bacterium]|nr:tadD [Rhodospirillales bacterium]
MAVDIQACKCGSGLRTQRCCGYDLNNRPPPGSAKQLLPLVERAARALELNQFDIAEQLALEVLELAPVQPGALSTLYKLRRARNNIPATEALLRRFVFLYPNELGATCDLALMLKQIGKLGDAEIHARNGVRIAPTNPVPHNLMGMILTDGNRPRVGEFHYKRVLELTGGRDPILLANLAWNLKTQGRIAEARVLYEESVAAAPNIMLTWLGWARMEEADRNFARAFELLDKAAALAPEHQGVELSRAVLHGRMQDYDSALAILDRMKRPDGAQALGADELMEKGRLLDKVGRYEEAFAAYAESKRLVRTGTGNVYMDQIAADQMGRLKTFFTAGRMQFTPRAGVRTDVPQPLFILGFPRSGTTLVEQTLTAHPNICAGDELPFVNEITQIMPRMLNSPLAYPEALAELWMGDQREGLDNLRDYSLQRVRQLGILTPGATWFTDKMPLNETHLGLIALLFPQAPLIHVLRHPLDVVLSVFSNHLTHGFFCSMELETAARHYVRVMELGEHYRAEMTLRYLPIRYEDIVGDQEASVRRMLAFIGEPFDECCLDFTENRRYARTASYAQVTEKLYDRSRYRYRNYRAFLEPVVSILQPAITRLGYTVGWPAGAGADEAA